MTRTQWRTHGAEETCRRPRAKRGGPDEGPRTDGKLTGPKGPATPAGQQRGDQVKGHGTTAATRDHDDGPRPKGGHRSPRDGPRPHGGHTECRGWATPPRQLQDSQGTGHAPKASTLDPGDGPRPHGGQARFRGRATPPRS